MASLDADHTSPPPDRPTGPVTPTHHPAVTHRAIGDRPTPDRATTDQRGADPAARNRIPSNGLVWAALLVVYVVWGSTYLAIRISTESLPPFLSAAARFGVAALVLAIVLIIRKGRGALRVDRRQAISAGTVGLLLLAGGNGMVVFAESPGLGVPSGIAALLVATVPLLIVILRGVFADTPRRATVLGVLVGFAGLVVLVLPHGSRAAVPLLPALVVVGAALSWSIGSFFSGRMRMPADPFAASAWEMAVGAAGLVVMGLASGERVHLASVTGRSWLALVYLIVAGSLVGFTAYVWLLHHAPISLVSTYAYVNPAVAVVLGALLLSEPITGQVLLGGAVIVLGVAVVVSTERRHRANRARRQPVAAGGDVIPAPRAEGAADTPAVGTSRHRR